MKKRIILYSLLSALFFVSCNSSEEGKYDTRAIESLDKLTETIGKMESLSYTVEGYIVNEKSEEISKLSDVYLKGANKMFIENQSNKGNKSFWYNGEKFAYFLFNKNEYDILDAPDNTLKLIDSINNKYGIYFPAADFLYPSLTDDLMDNYDQILYFGDENINDVACIVLEATNEETIVQIWIVKETNLPHKMIVESKTNENKYYEAEYSNWRINPKLPDIMFEFLPPSGSNKVKFQPLNKK
ncbi:MAG: DUF2092 domain-containing protein [Flavobacteriaceae bacterium]|nr:DUF2092 domain-containing protein [Flavobacteriaceae bacterium]